MGWEFWIDRGGTFTDVVARHPDGHLETRKLLSESPGHYQDAALAGIRASMGIAHEEPIPSQQIDVVKMGTTVATNALLEHKGEPCVLVTTRGFADALEIAYQNRPDIFALNIIRPAVLYDRVIEVDERIGANGEILCPLAPEPLILALKAAFSAGYRSLAVVLMHAWRFPQHEQQIQKLARDIGFPQVSTSHEASNLIKFVGRGHTCVADAYLSPVLQRYIRSIQSELGQTQLQFMQSNGGLADAKHFRGKDSILSGPAGGIVAAIATSTAAGQQPIISFDMGGTSTDVAHYKDELERSVDRQVAGVHIRAPMMQIHTVAAGGGSVVTFDGKRFRVGPASAGAHPGPACYGRGGPLTVTDCNLYLGRLASAYFPKLFGRSGQEPLDSQVVAQRLQELVQQQEHPKTATAIAEGCLDIAVANMANAIKKISVQRGYDVTQYTLCCLGGAGAQLVCRVADALAMKKVLIHPLAGVLSAYGMGQAETRTSLEQTVEKPLAEHSVQQLRCCFLEMEEQVRKRLAGEQLSQIRCLWHLQLKYQGTDTPLALPFNEDAGIRFEEEHERRYGFRLPDRAVQVASLTCEAIGTARGAYEEGQGLDWGAPPTEPIDHVPMETTSGTLQIPVYRWDGSVEQVTLQGPALIINRLTTIFVDEGWCAQAGKQLLLERVQARSESSVDPSIADPVMLEIFNNLFMSIAEQMGTTLASTAASVNIKERLDFSCALFDRNGCLIANAPHIPVHLGSMGETVAALIKARTLRPGEVYATNNPYKGGTHLPDITVITPVFIGSEEQPRFFTASRGHHADIGGISPGSMPSNSTHINQEGALLDELLLVNAGQFQENQVRAVFMKGPYPARQVSQNLADLRAQVAANARGQRELTKVVAQFGLEVVIAYMGHVRHYASACVGKELSGLGSGSFTLEMDHGAMVNVTVTVDRKARRARVNFEGSSDQQTSNFNAPASICRAAVLYVFRSLVREEIPLNEGCLEPIEIQIPSGSFLAPAYPAAVVAGNVETSQIITDALFGALGRLAAGQGTMNNLTFGNALHQYYETICGGAGAGPGFKGADAIHTHMTNSRMTDPEVLEMQYPVLLETFAIRQNSGGAGQWRGGHGAVRRIRFLADMTVSILSGRRRVPPFGLAGGEAGSLGVNTLIRANGDRETLAGLAGLTVGVGDRLEIKTPGGGGYGPQCR